MGSGTRPIDSHSTHSGEIAQKVQTRTGCTKRGDALQIFPIWLRFVNLLCRSSQVGWKELPKRTAHH
jgi:hypothetical protein